MKRVTVKDLSRTPNYGECLYCAKCGARNSCNASDYFLIPASHVFRCCGVPMRLVRVETHVVCLDRRYGT